jgi:class 3 adenylate cyclase
MERIVRGRPLSLAARINLVVVATLVLGLGLVAYLFASSLTQSRESLVERSLERESEILYLSIENFMLPGEAPIAAEFFADVAGLESGFKLALYRRDGRSAFSDNATIAMVNSNIKRERFAPRDVEPAPMAIAEADRAYFDRAVEIPPESVVFSVKEGGLSFKRVYRPLVNLPKCVSCHGGDHTIRGVIDIRADVSDVVRDQAITVAASVGGFAIMAFVLAAVIGRILRSVVVGPVLAIGRLCRDVSGGDFSGRVDVNRRDEIGGLAATVNEMVGGLRERYELTKYVSAGTITSLGSGQEPRRVERTLLFTDVRGFTAYTERHGAEAILSVLNKLLERQAEIIASHGGDVDKFVGDAVVSVFSGADAPARACAAAADIKADIAARASDYDDLSVGAGIATGSVVQGMVGSSRRADFTVLGDAVNVASRLCSLAKPGQILVCDCTRDRLEAGAFSLSGPYRAKLKGKAEAQIVYILGGGAPDTGLKEASIDR